MPRKKIEYIACSQCGSQMPKGSAFCSACGAKIEEKKNEYIICKHCGNQTPKLSIYCMHCGSQLVKAKKTNKKSIRVPEPRLMSSGKWYIYLRMNGKGISITKDKREDCIAEAVAMKRGIIEVREQRPKIPLRNACRDYIDSRSKVLSPSTVAGYEDITRNRFKSFMDQDIYAIDFQKMINDEECGAKTLKNAWMFIKCCVSAKDKSLVPEKLTLPQVIDKDLPWLDCKQIKKFLKAIEGNRCEMGALLGLHGLRKSEILAVTPEKIYNGAIHVEGSKVTDKNGKIVEKETNKNVTSRREVPVLIPRLNELLKQKNYASGKSLVSPYDLYDQINAVCEENKLPLIGVHGLRRSFVSLCYSQGINERICMAWGGWSDVTVMHKKYIKLSGADQAEAINKIKNLF